MDAMLLCCGEVGYRKVSVEQVYRRYGGCRSEFYRHFQNKSDCFLAAYEVEVGRLCDNLLSFAGSDSPPRRRLQEALEALARYLADKPLRARALFSEVHLAGPNALRTRAKALEKLGDGLTEACRLANLRPDAPPITAEFLLHAIEQAAVRALAAEQPQEFAEAVPELTALICQFLGDDGEPYPI